jgi:S-adenosylmethionine-diacylglycerol 3-amino-3-carboxypropyl transferase
MGKYFYKKKRSTLKTLRTLRETKTKQKQKTPRTLLLCALCEKQKQKKLIMKEVSFEFIRYANCWEDADILLEGLNCSPNSRILSVGSAGDNSFSLLTTSPEIVVAVDVSAVQLYLIELKKVAIQRLEYSEVLAFLGFRASDNRLVTFEELKSELSKEAASYWSKNIEAIETGVIHKGKFEQYFQLFANKVLLFIHSKKTVNALFDKKTAAEQANFYDKKWNNCRWQMLFKIFFSRYIMGKLGRDPEFLKEVKVNVGNHIFQKAERQLKSVAAQENFILKYNLTGSFGDLLPHYLQPNNFEVIKANIEKLHLKQGFAEEAINEFGPFDAMNLSNIFEYMNDEIFETTTQSLIAGLNKGGRMAYWNLMVARRMSSIQDNELSYQKELSEKLTAVDKGFFYGGFLVDEK